MRGQTSSDDEVVSLLEGLGAKSEIVNDPRNKVGKLFDSTTYPTMVVLGKSGKIQGVTVGNVTDLETRARNQINAALGLNAGASAKPRQTGRRVTIGDSRK